MQGQPCYEPDTVESHATYAFNAYYHGMGMASGTCYFSGVAAITTSDPSKIRPFFNRSCHLLFRIAFISCRLFFASLFAGRGSCVYSGKNGSALLNGTSLAPSSNSTQDSGAPWAVGDVSTFVRTVLSALLLLGVLLML
jgi:glucan endo-1,3-beta-glucosidase 1/2/3